MPRLRHVLFLPLSALLLVTRAVPEEERVDVRAFLPASALAYAELTSLRDTWARLRSLSLEGLSDDDRAKREKLLREAARIICPGGG